MPRRSLSLIALLCLLYLTAAGAEPVERFSLYEASFTATGAYSNPYAELDAHARLKCPDGSFWTIPLFWDGSDTWRLRISPDTPGRWSYRIHSADSGLDGRTGSFNCVPSTLPGSIVPMTGHPNHFQYQNGQPMWFLGDTAWSYLTSNREERHGREQSERYAATRATQGFNVIHSMMLSEAGDGNEGGPPFNDISTEDINPGYWRELDHRLAFANSRGLVVGLALAWGDKRKVEPYTWRRFPNLAARRRYARYVAARNSAYRVYFIVSGEWHAEARTRPGATAESVFQEFVTIGETLDAADPHGRMIAIHPMTRRGSVREFLASSWMSFGDYQQNYQHLHRRILVSQRTGLPVVNSEYGYYLRDFDGNGEVDKSNSFSAEDMRFASWDIVTAGGYLVTGFGSTYFGGHRSPGPFNVDNPANDDWEAQIQHLKRFFTSLDYWKLIPADELLVSDTPRGADRSRDVLRGQRRSSLDRPPATTYWAMTIPGETYVVYTRGLVASVDLNFDSRPGEFRVRLFNPQTGQFSGAADFSGPVYTFNPPDTHDWVVLIERKP